MIFAAMIVTARVLAAMVFPREGGDQIGVKPSRAERIDIYPEEQRYQIARNVAAQRDSG
jgi:hypothetical protein